MGMTAAFEEAEGIDATVAGNINIYPNPLGNGVINIKSDIALADITIVNLSGLPVFQNNIENKKYVNVNVSQFADGYYLVRLTDKEGNVTTRRLVKIH